MKFYSGLYVIKYISLKNTVNKIVDKLVLKDRFYKNGVEN